MYTCYRSYWSNMVDELDRQSNRDNTKFHWYFVLNHDRKKLHIENIHFHHIKYSHYYTLCNVFDMGMNLMGIEIHIELVLLCLVSSMYSCMLNILIQLFSMLGKDLCMMNIDHLNWKCHLGKQKDIDRPEKLNWSSKKNQLNMKNSCRVNYYRQHINYYKWHSFLIHWGIR